MSWPYKYESGVTHFDKSKAFFGYTLITTMPRRSAPEPNQSPGEVMLMDMKGETVHTWKTPYPPWYSRLMPDGHLVVVQGYQLDQHRKQQAYHHFHKKDGKLQRK